MRTTNQERTGLVANLLFLAALTTTCSINANASIKLPSDVTLTDEPNISVAFSPGTGLSTAVKDDISKSLNNEKDSPVLNIDPSKNQSNSIQYTAIILALAAGLGSIFLIVWDYLAPAREEKRNRQGL